MDFSQSQLQKQEQKQSQRQVQRLSQRQIQAISMLHMKNQDLRNEIYKFVNENPALEIINDSEIPHPKEKFKSLNYIDSTSSDKFQRILESQEDRPETLQQHLLDQLNMIKTTPDEFEVCQKLIYNLDKNGCYGSMVDPITLLDSNRPLQTPALLSKCIDKIQRMDPIGTCCKTPEESLFVQAKIAGNASDLTLFILDGHLELLSPPIAEKVKKRLIEYRKNWHSKKFAPWIILDEIKITTELVQEAIDYILTLNPRPAGDYISDTTTSDFYRPDIILQVKRKKGSITSDDFSKGIIFGNKETYFQVYYASGEIPEIRISDNQNFDKKLIDEAKEFIANLKFRESTMVQQGCAIISKQRDFFLKGPGNLKPLTRREIAKIVKVHESTVSRISSKEHSKYIQTEWGLFPLSYFFTSGIANKNSKEKISSEVIKKQITEFIRNAEKPLSDNELTKLLNEQGIKIARRTVTKYRGQLGITNSFSRK